MIVRCCVQECWRGFHSPDRHRDFCELRPVARDRHYRRGLRGRGSGGNITTMMVVTVNLQGRILLWLHILECFLYFFLKGTKSRIDPVWVKSGARVIRRVDGSLSVSLLLDYKVVSSVDSLQCRDICKIKMKMKKLLELQQQHLLVCQINDKIDNGFLCKSCLPLQSAAHDILSSQTCCLRGASCGVLLVTDKCKAWQEGPPAWKKQLCQTKQANQMAGFASLKGTMERIMTEQTLLIVGIRTLAFIYLLNLEMTIIGPHQKWHLLHCCMMIQQDDGNMFRAHFATPGLCCCTTASDI